jgi:hypothetical protein
MKRRHGPIRSHPAPGRDRAEEEIGERSSSVETSAVFKPRRKSVVLQNRNAEPKPRACRSADIRSALTVPFQNLNCERSVLAISAVAVAASSICQIRLRAA